MSEETLPKQEGQQDENKEQKSEVKKPDPQQLILPEEIQNLINEMPAPQQQAVKAILLGVSVKNHTYRSPIPPPDILKGYNDVIPNGAERILAMTEKQAEHRMMMENTVIAREQHQSEKGQNYGLIIALSFLVGSVFLIYTGHDTAGGILGTVDLVALVSAFIYGKRGQRQGGDKK